jgi:hypothetical protein
MQLETTAEYTNLNTARAQSNAGRNPSALHIRTALEQKHDSIRVTRSQIHKLKTSNYTA